MGEGVTHLESLAEVTEGQDEGAEKRLVEIRRKLCEDSFLRLGLRVRNGVAGEGVSEHSQESCKGTKSSAAFASLRLGWGLTIAKEGEPRSVGEQNHAEARVDDDVGVGTKLVGRTDLAAVRERHLSASSETGEPSDDGGGSFVDFVDDDRAAVLRERSGVIARRDQVRGAYLDGAEEGRILIMYDAPGQARVEHEGLGGRIAVELDELARSHEELEKAILC